MGLEDAREILDELNFSVIVSIDIPGDEDIETYLPNLQCKEQLDETEGDAQYEYNYLEGRWKTGHHRKWIGILDHALFEELCSQYGFEAEHTETMGSIGAPGLGFGRVPAVSFHSDDDDLIGSMYVTPFPDKGPPREITEKQWERWKEALLVVYG